LGILLASCAHTKSRFSIFDISALDNIGLSVKQKYIPGSHFSLFNIMLEKDNLPGIEYVLRNYTVDSLYVNESVASKEFISNIKSSCSGKNRYYYRSVDNKGSCIGGNNSTRRMLAHIVSNDYSLSLAVSVESLEADIMEWNVENKNALFSYAIINSPSNESSLPCKSLIKCLS